MSDDTKTAWNARSEHLHAVLRIDEFCELPRPLFGLLDSSSKLFLRKEVDLFKAR